MMLDWNQYRQQLLTRIGAFGRQSPGTEALGVAIAVNAGAALVYSARAMDAIAALEPQT
jgi:hypothetical protein